MIHLIFLTNFQLYLFIVHFHKYNPENLIHYHLKTHAVLSFLLQNTMYIKQQIRFSLIQLIFDYKMTQEAIFVF